MPENWRISKILEMWEKYGRFDLGLFLFKSIYFTGKKITCKTLHIKFDCPNSFCILCIIKIIYLIKFLIHLWL